MQIKNFIQTKQDSQKLSDEDINYFIKNLDDFSQDEITQWLKAVKANGLDDDETSALTLAMAKSGNILDWKELEPTVDKHSTGGIGDKITLLFVPLIAAYGINIPKLSGRSLGITGGTIDKLESIPGFKTNLSISEIKEQVKKIGLAVCSTSSDLAPADKKLYSIRDVTDTIDSIPLIASSIMSKKIAVGSKNIILDVKAGSGAFMKTIKDAKLLANKMVNIGKNLNKNIKAVVTDMNEPLGHKIGNALEIKEVIEVLSGKEIDDLTEIVIYLAKETIDLINPDEKSKEEKLKHLFLNGSVLKKFEEMVKAQGGNLNIDLPKARYIEVLKSKSDGYIQKLDAQTVGEAVFNLGAGRKSVSDSIDHSVGIVLLKNHGNKVIKDEPLLEIHAKSKEDADKVKEKLLSGIIFGQNPSPKLKLIHEIIK
ncbi:MAG: thymidine phosphorylase [Candidatus Melainabacteria bacterium RIFCSPLOWO2_12_FULL_35_11]|nr:MAG: thymidine phosphorylase [Candidatus Melainabacteria bacterium RIFCSPLOWO2_12_FULL_35_11]